MENQEDEKDLPKIFLNDGSISEWEKPTGPWNMGVRPHAYTQILAPLGTNQVIAETAGDFMVYASAVTYLADIIKSNGEIVYLESKKTWKELVEGKSERRVLISGGIQIYERGIPEVRKKSHDSPGFHLRRTGEIWYAETPKPDYQNHLREVIFGDSKKDKDRTERIEEILRGYMHQDIERQGQESRARHQALEDGRFSLIRD